MQRILRKLILFVSILGLLFVSACVQKTVTSEAEKAKGPSVMEQVKADGFEIVDFDYVKGKVGNGLRKFNQVVIIDSRPERLYDEGHIPSSINIPDTKFEKFYPQLEDFKVTKDTELIVYCGGLNCIKSYNNARYLKNKGYKNIKVYLAGDPDWSMKSFMEVGFNSAKKMLSEGVIFIDARPDRVYEKGTISGSINIPDIKFLAKPDAYISLLPQDKTTKMVIFCGGYACIKSHNVAEKLYSMGYTSLFVYAGGEPEWKEKGEKISNPGEKAEISKKDAGPVSASGVAVKAGKDEGTVDKEFFKTLIDNRPGNILIVDVRNPQEFQNGHINGAINIPVDDIYKDCSLVTSKLPGDKYVIFVCVSGGRAGEMYFGLKEDCKYPETDRLFFLDAHVSYAGGKCEIK